MSKHNKGNGIQIETENATTWILNKAFIPTGRIKRMRGITPNRWARIDKRIGHKRYAMIEEMNWEIFENTMFGITRWNRH